MGLFPGNPGSLNSPPRVRRCGQLSSYLSGPQGTSCPASPNFRGHDDGCACALLLPLAKQNPAWLGQGRLSLAFGAVDVCILPDASRHLPPGCCARLPLLLGVSAPEPSDALPHTGGPGLSCHSGKETSTSGGFSINTPHPASGRSVSGLGVQGTVRNRTRVSAGGRDAALFSQPDWGYFTLLCFSGALDSSRDQAGERLTRCRAGAPREVGRVTATSEEPCRPQGSVWGRVLSSCRGWTDAAVA